MVATVRSPNLEDAQPQNLRVAPAGASSAAHICLHCGQPITEGAQGDFCCFGCRTVHGALRSAGLTRFYELRGAGAEPVGELQLERRDHQWLSDAVREAGDGTRSVLLRAQGIRCTACVWLIEQVFARHSGGQRIVVNPTLGTLDLRVGRDFDLPAFAAEVERFGYLLGPDHADPEVGERDTLLVRLGVCTALAANAMMFSAAIYLGLHQGRLFDLLHRLNYGAATLSVLIGGPVFFGSALQALRRRVLHLDVPIAAGIALTYGAATWSFLGDHRAVAYFDSLSVFIALMLLGRYLQERLIVQNRRALLAGDEIAQLRCVRLAGGRLVPGTCGAIAEGDVLLIAPGDLIPLDAELIDAAASCSLDWISGEPEPKAFTRGGVLPAGAFNVGTRAIRVRACSAFAQSPLIALLRSPDRGVQDDRGLSRFTGAYVIGVVLLAGGGLLYHGVRGQWIAGLAAATAVCVVTCPCAIGIAIPLAYDLVHAQLRRAGLFVREGGFLDRARHVRRVVFDKTGTLTTGQLRVLDPQALLALPRSLLQDLYDMVARSLHPQSIALRRLLDDLALEYRPEIDVHEHVGSGLEAVIDGRRYRLGKPGWADAAAADAATDGALVYAIDGACVIRLRTEEVLRPDAAHEVHALQTAGYETWILSGDAPARVAAAAAALELDAARALGGQSPADKASFVRTHDADTTLMIGDGGNDAAALAAARCSGTPAVDRGLIAARSDFYFTTSGLAPIRSALLAARKLARVVRTNIAFALLYNAGAVALSLAGVMQPWLAALAMPASSIAIVALTTTTLSPRRHAWRS